MYGFYSIVKFIHLLSIVVWVGGMIFFSFFASHSIFKLLPKGAAGLLLGDIFPKYWVVSIASGAAALTTLLVISFKWARVFPFMQVATITIMLALTVASGLVVLRKAGAIRNSAAAGVIDDAQTDELRRAHSTGSVLNITVVFLGIVLVYLTSKWF